MRILVTGALGTIGRHLVPTLQKRGHCVTCADLAIGSGDDYIRADVRCERDLARLFAACEPDVVIHMAGEVGVENGEEHPDAMLDVNTHGALNVARLCVEHDSFLVYFSTSEVFGETFDETTVTEDTAINAHACKNVYAISKLAGEMLVRHFENTQGLEAAIVRPFMVYGPGESANRYRSALVRFCAHAVAGETLSVHRGAERAWCHVTDFCDGVARICEQGDPGVYHVGGTEYVSMEDLAALIVEEAGSGAVEVIDPPRYLRSMRKRFTMDNTLALGYEPQVGIVRGVKEVVSEIRGQR